MFFTKNFFYPVGVLVLSGCHLFYSASSGEIIPGEAEVKEGFYTVLADFSSEIPVFDSKHFPGWKETVSGPSAGLMEEGGRRGLGQKEKTGAPLSVWYGIRSDIPYHFLPGDQIICTWYNGSSLPVRYVDKYGNPSDYFKPLISFQDTDGPLEGETFAPDAPEWFPFRSTDYRWWDLDGSYSPKKLGAGGALQTIYTVTAPETAPGQRSATSGARQNLLVLPQADIPGLLLEKIEYVSADAAGPDAPVLTVSSGEDPSSQAVLSWTEAEESFSSMPSSVPRKISYRIYRDGRWIAVTDTLTWTDGSLSASTTYNYAVRGVNYRTPGPPSAGVSLTTSALSSFRQVLDPGKDLEYLGAFRLPQEPGLTWKYRQGDMAWYPQGDPEDVDGDGDFPGSLYINKGQTSTAEGPQMVEISIPGPVRAGFLDQLPAARVLRGPSGYKRTDTFTPSLPAKNGLAYLPEKNLFYFSVPYGYWAEKDWATHGAFSADFIRRHGLWYLRNPDGSRPLHYRAYSGYMGVIPADWAAAWTPGMRLLGGTSKPSYSGKGPMLYAFRPDSSGGTLLPDVDEPTGVVIPPEPVSLAFRALIEYDSTTSGGSRQAHGWVEDDNWNGVEWIGSGRASAVVFTGMKARGEYFYGFRDDRDGTVNAEASAILPALDTAAEYKEGSKGPRARRYEPQMVFYDPGDLEKVARGELSPALIQPYTGLDLTPWLLEEFRTSVPFYSDRIGTVTSDPVRGLLYVAERIVSRTDPLVNHDVIHVWRCPGP